MHSKNRCCFIELSDKKASPEVGALGCFRRLATPLSLLGLYAEIGWAYKLVG
jgi:hypothetical protein